MGFVRIGIDIGQRQDPTALAVVELERREGELHFVARHIERLALGTPYPAVADRLAEIHGKLAEAGHNVQTWLDATGVGQPVVDMMRVAGVPLTPVYLTGTDKATWDGGSLSLGKAVLVSRLQVLLQSGRIHLPKTAEAQALINELLVYEIRVTDAGHAQFGAFRVGTHDDLATALGLACWQEPRPARIDRGSGPVKRRRPRGEFDPAAVSWGFPRQNRWPFPRGGRF